MGEMVIELNNSKSKSKCFHEIAEGDKSEVAAWVSVEAGDYFVTVETDPYEGSAMFHVSCVDKLIESLRRAKAHVLAQGRVTDPCG